MSSPQGSQVSQGSQPPEDIAAVYSRHIEEAQTILQNGATSLESLERVRELLEASSVYCKKERCVQETLMGGTALSICAQISKNQAQSLDTNLCAFDPNSFSTGIRNAILDLEKNNPRPEWNRLAVKVSRMFKRAPVFSYMYGSFKPTEPPPKVPKERTPKQRRVADAAEKKKPEKIQTVEASDKGNDQALFKMKKLLTKEFGKRNNEPMNFFECVLHPESFSRSVENIFNLSFLIRDNFIRVEANPNSLPVIYLVPSRDSDRYRGARKKQCIVSINTSQWKELIRILNITKPMIP